MLPSCVPATPFEHSGAKLVAEDMEQFMHKSRILGLGEVMDANSVINCSQEMLDKLRLFDGKPIDGLRMRCIFHAPGNPFVEKHHGTPVGEDETKFADIIGGIVVMPGNLP